MTKEELGKELVDANMRADAYSIDGEIKNECLVLEQVDSSNWRIYFSERGLRTGEKYFNC